MYYNKNTFSGDRCMLCISTSKQVLKQVFPSFSIANRKEEIKAQKQMILTRHAVRWYKYIKDARSDIWKDSIFFKCGDSQ